MPRALTTRVIGTEDAIKNLNKVGVRAKLGLRDVVARAATKVTTGAKRRAAVDTGRLRASIHATFFRGGLAAEVGTDVHYAPHIEFGTRPHFPPVTALRPWARRVLKDESLAFVVARAIAERGTPPRPFLFPAWEEVRPQYLREVRARLRKDVTRRG